MMCVMHNKSIVGLSDSTRAPLTKLTKKGHVATDKIRHAHIRSKAEAVGPARADVRLAESVAVRVSRARGGRQRFVNPGRDAAAHLKQQAQPSQSPRLAGEGKARLIARQCSTPLDGSARWTLRLVVDQAVAVEIGEAIFHETVHPVRKNMR